MSSSAAFEPRWIELDGAANVRDLGGLPTLDGATVRIDRLIRADSLQELSATDVRHLVDDLHVTAVVDLRTGVEVRGEGPGPMTREPGVDVRHLSLFPEAGETTDAAATEPSGTEPSDTDPSGSDPSGSDPSGSDQPVILPWQARDAELAEDQQSADQWRRGASRVYLRYLDERADSILAALRLIAGTDGATIVHCAAGKDRTGTVIALALAEVGVRPEAIVDDYARSAERVEQVFRRLAQRRTYAGDISGKVEDVDKHKPRAETMRDLLAAVDEVHGGASAWLRRNGWTDTDAAALRAKLLD